MKGVKEMHDGLLSSSAHLAPSVRPVQRRKKLTVADYVRGIEQGDRVILSRAITLVESNNKDHFKLAQQVLQAVLPRTGKALRIGITGVPVPVKVHLLKPLATCSLKLVTRLPYSL